MEYDRLFHAHTPETLPIEPFLDTGMQPLTELLPEGMKYFFPTLVSFVLCTPCPVHSDWAGVSVLNRLRAAHFIQEYTSHEKDAIINFLLHLRRTRPDLIEDFYSVQGFDITLDLWRQAN